MDKAAEFDKLLFAARRVVGVRPFKRRMLAWSALADLKKMVDFYDAHMGQRRAAPVIAPDYETMGGRG